MGTSHNLASHAPLWKPVRYTCKVRNSSALFTISGAKDENEMIRGAPTAPELKNVERGDITTQKTIASDVRCPQQSEKANEITHEVFVRCSIHNLTKIDMQAQSFSVTATINASWRLDDQELLVEDVRVDSDKSEWRKGIFYIVNSDKRFFAPGLYIKNVIDMDEETGWKDSGWVTHDNEKGKALVHYHADFKGEFQELMELKYFPVDTQALTLKIMSSFQAPSEAKRGRKADKYDENDGIRVKLIEDCSDDYRSICNQKDFCLKHEYDLSPVLLFEEGTYIILFNLMHDILFLLCSIFHMLTIPRKIQPYGFFITQKLFGVEGAGFCHKRLRLLVLECDIPNIHDFVHYMRSFCSSCY